MNTVSYIKVCKGCQTSNGARGTIFVTDEINDVHKLTEYEYSKEINEWLHEEKINCEYCGCPYFDLLDVEINGYRLYDFDRLAELTKKTNGEFFIWGIERVNGQLQLKLSGKTTVDPLFLEECFKKIIETHNTINFGEMSPHNLGYVRIAFTGKYSRDFDDIETFNPIIQRFLCRGLLMHEFHDCIKYQLNHFELNHLADLLIDR